MAFQTEPQKINPGSLNLLAPSDQVPGDCLELTNFRCDQAGKLVQSRGLTQQFVDDGINRDSLLLVGANRYHGGNGGLWINAVALAIDSGYSVDPLALVSFQGFAWVMNPTKQRRATGSTVCNWTPETPGAIVSVVATPAAGSLAAGNHEYYITFEDDSWEGNPSAKTTKATAANDLNTITRPAAVGAEITGWNVYVLRPNLAVPYKLNNAAIPIATATYADKGDAASLQDDASLTDRNLALEPDHDAAPAAKVAADKPHNGRLLVANSAAHPNRVWFTPALRPWFFRGSANTSSGDWVDVGDSNDAVLAITVKSTFVMIYKQKTVWRIRGDIASGQIDLIAPDVGAVGLRSVAAASEGDYVGGREGIYISSGDWVRRLPWSDKVLRIFQGEAVQIAVGIGANGMDNDYRSRMALGVRNGRLWCSYVTSASASHRPDMTFIVHLATGRIAWRQNSAVVGQSGWNAFYNEGENGDFLGGRSGTFDTLEDGLTDNGGAMDVAYQSRYEDQGLPDREKQYEDLVVLHNTRGATLTVKAFTNKGVNTATYDPGTGAVSQDEIVLGTISSTTETRSCLALKYPSTGGGSAHPKAGQPIEGFNLSWRVEGQSNNAAASPIEIPGPIELHFRVLARKGVTFDTGPIDLGAVGQLDELDFDVDAPAQVNLTIYKALPGETISSAATPTISATTGRQDTRVVPTKIEGQLIRILGTSASAFKVYELRIRVRRLGVHLSGALSQVYDTLESAIGI